MLALICSSAVMLGLYPISGQPCTGIRLSADDGTCVRARTMEFGIDPSSEIIAVPRGYLRTGTTPDGKPGLTWKTRYASLGANALGTPMIIDGVNEKGLSAGLFYFPNMAGYMRYTPRDANKTIAPWEVGSWALDNFATIDEVKRAIAALVVPAVMLTQWSFSPPLHYIVVDGSGNSIVIEYINGSLHVYDDPLGVITNSPAFDWHMTNLRNYVNFSLTNHPPVELGSITLQPFGQGSGMLGMPGDFTPPSRFVRAAALSQSVFTPKTGTEAILEAFHILNNFDIPKGAIRDTQRDQYGNVLADYTIWTSATDLKARRYYFKTYDDSQIRVVDLARINASAPTITHFSMSGKEPIQHLNR